MIALNEKNQVPKGEGYIILNIFDLISHMFIQNDVKLIKHKFNVLINYKIDIRNA